MELFRPDSPINTREEDKFQRYEFSKRIADIASTGKYPKSLVIGVYGKWGEGKTSVLNCVETEVGDRAMVIRFNPWYFADQAQLLKAFFVEIAAALGKKMTKKSAMVAKAIGDYGESIGSIMEFMPVPAIAGKMVKTAGDIGKKVHDKVGTSTIQAQKKRVDEFIVESGANILVIIDDIDRLDAAETQMVFKLVKLVGDFPRTTYLLAFDDEIVASALAPQFGKSSDSIPGHTFLEKIIQMPLHLPKASALSMRTYALELLNDTLTQIKVELTEAEKADFIQHFDTTFMPALVNPRMAVRFANDIGFTLPLLKSEVNISDLMVIEGIKIFFPPLHYFIKHNPSVFVKNKPAIKDLISGSKENSQDVKDTIEAELKKYGALQDSIREMLWSMFPQLQKFYQNMNYGGEFHYKWYAEKRICSPLYFYKYFSFTVDPKDIPDVYFDEFISKFGNDDLNSLVVDTKSLLARFDTDTVLFKMRSAVRTLPFLPISNLGLVLSQLGEYFTKGSIIDGQQRAEVVRIIMAISVSVAKHVNAIDYAKLVLSQAQPMEFAAEIYRAYKHQIHEKEYGGESIESGLGGIREAMIAKFESLMPQEQLDVLGDFELVVLFHIYNENGAKERIANLLSSRLNEQSEFSLRLLKIFIPTTRQSGNPQPFKSNFDQVVFNDILNFVNGQQLYDCTVAAFGKIELKHASAPYDQLDDETIIATYQKMYLERFDNNGQPG